MVIQELRKKKKMTQQQLADAVGITRGAVSMWETGKSQPDNSVLIRLAELFGVSTDYILGIDENKKSPPADDAQAEQMLTSEQKQILEIFDSLDERGKESLMHLALGLAGFLRK